MAKIFIDGSAGPTGLKIYERLSTRKDLELLILDDNLRKNDDARREMLNKADVAFLCLPDEAAIEAVKMVENPNTVIIDTSTAHRVVDGWTYGFPELSGMRKKIATSKRIANPGCHASGFIALIKPLVEKGFLDKDTNLSCFSLTGYSGGGKKMIAEYEDENRDILLDAPRLYALTQNHKHLKEMKKICQLNYNPVFSPIVAPYFSGMEVVVPIFEKQLYGSFDNVKELYKRYYKNGLVKYVDCADEKGFLSANALSGKDNMQITVVGHEERMLLIARYDNLGKGASGAAIQNMNIILGVNENTGLSL